MNNKPTAVTGTSHASEPTTTRLAIQGMSCAGCVATVEKALSSVTGVVTASVNFAEHTATVSGTAAPQSLIQAVTQAGYSAIRLRDADDETTKTAAENTHYHRLLTKTIVSSTVAIPLLLFGMSGYIPALSESTRGLWLGIGLITAAVLLFSGRHFYLGAWKAFRRHHANMDTLIALGTGSAWVYSTIVCLLPNLGHDTHVYFEAAIIITALVNLGATLEWRARRDTSSAIRKLIGLQPAKATVIRNGMELEIPLRDIVPDDTIRIRPGEKIPADGVIIDGHTTIDQSMLTGEPQPVVCQAGDKLVGGTLNVTGSILLRATAVGDQTVLAQIVTLVRNAQSAKPALGRLADQVAGIFVPAVLIIAVATALAWLNFGPEPRLQFAFTATMTVLIIACPCALGLATPTSIIVGIGRAAQNGILIRNGEALQSAGRITTVVLDKTGTITEGHPKVVATLAPYRWHEEDVLRMAASLEHHSEHPIANAIIAAAKAAGVQLDEVTGFENAPGYGVRGTWRHASVLVGNDRFLNQAGISIPTSSSVDSHQDKATRVHVAVDNEFAGTLFIQDPIKENTARGVAQLRAAGFRVFMLTGDNEASARAVADSVGIGNVIAGVLPAEKSATVAKLQQEGHVVAMVGDGINDAPALSQADVGFAVGTGTDIAIESADVTLIGNPLQGVRNAILISRATIKNIHQNLFGAFIYNVVGIPVAAGALYPLFGTLLNPMIAGAAMALSSVTVVTNANRLRFASLDER